MVRHQEGGETVKFSEEMLAAACAGAAKSLALETMDRHAHCAAHVFSPRFEQKMAALLRHMKHDKYRKLTTTAKVLLVAALLAMLALSGYAARETAGHIVNDFGLYSTYRFFPNSDIRKKERMVCSYIPEGFEIRYNEFTSFQHFIEYVNDDGLFFSIAKRFKGDSTNIDTENCEIDEVEVNGVIYFITTKYVPQNGCDCTGIIWNKNDDLFSLYGTLPKEEALKIALETE